MTFLIHINIISIVQHDNIAAEIKIMIQRMVPGALKTLSCMVYIGGLVFLFILNFFKKLGGSLVACCFDIIATGYNNTTLVTVLHLVHPTAGDSVAVRLSASMGQDLFDKLVSSDVIVTSNDFFIDYFKGLALVDGGGNNLVMGFKDSMV